MPDATDMRAISVSRDAMSEQFRFGKTGEQFLLTPSHLVEYVRVVQ